MEIQYTGPTRIFNIEKMKSILDQGISVESIDKDGKSFLRHACADGKSDIVKYLLSKGADPNSKDKDGKTPLMSAAISGKYDIVGLLLEHGADPTIETVNHDSAIKMAERWGKQDVVKLLLNAEQECKNELGTEKIFQSALLESEKHTIVEITPMAVKEMDLITSTVTALDPTPVDAAPTPTVTSNVSITTTVIEVVTENPQPSVQTDDFKMPELTTDDYIQALEKMKKSPKDRIGILGSLGATGIGAAAGGGLLAALGTTTATTTVAASVLGSQTLGSLLGASAVVPVVAATPVGWVIGGAIAAAALGYGVSKLISSGTRADMIKEMNMKELKEEIDKRISVAHNSPEQEDIFKAMVEALQLLVRNNKIPQSDCTELIAGVQSGIISFDYAFSTIEHLSKQ